MLTTRRNLSALATFLAIALTGLIIAMILNLILRSSAFDLALDGIGVLAFAGLIATDTQQLKDIYEQSGEGQGRKASSNYGALTLYLNFISLFQLLLSFIGDRSRR